MNKQKQEQHTWETLQNLQIDDPASEFKFSDRLARENSWTKKFSLQVIEEYKKFVFLAKHADHPVTPSLEVDEAWHLHMIYTRSYWNEMCKEIDYQLHHGPTKGGKVEKDKYTNWYNKTLESYRKYFGEPPINIWPDSVIRFAPARITKIDKTKYFLFRKPQFKFSTLSLLAIPIILFFTSMDTVKPTEDEGWSWWVWGLIIVAAWLLIAGIVRLIRGPKYNSRSSSSCGSDSSIGWIIFSCGSGCSSSNSGSGCSSGDSGCGSSCGGGCGD